MADRLQIVEVLERFAATMASKFQVNDALYELSDSTVAVLDAAGAGVSVANKQGQLLFVTATSEAVIEIERSQERNQAGPCVEAFTTGEVFVVDRIDKLDRWPDYQRVAEKVGFAAVIGVPLILGDVRLGSLNIYDARTRSWSDEEVRTAQVLAGLATTYVIRAGELEKANELGEQLQHALDSRVVIEQAKGMLARDHDVSVDVAFEMLRNHSRHRNTPLRDLADAVVRLGLELPSA